MLKAEVSNGKVVLDKEDFEEFMENLESTFETLEVLADKEVMRQINESEDDIKEGRTHKIRDKKDLKKLLGV